jgi:uncharacterized protein (TIGR02246 family)
MDDAGVADRLAIFDVLARYCQSCDDGEFERLSELFAEDGSFSHGGRVSAGRAGLIAYFEEIQAPERRGKHLVSNQVVTVDGDVATARSDWLFLKFVDGILTPHLTGRYDDALVRQDGRWLLAERVVTTLAPPA